MLIWGKARRKERKQRNMLKKLFHRDRWINTTTDTLLAIKKTYTAKIIHLRASVRSDGSAPWLGVHMNRVILHEYCVCSLPIQVVTFHLHEWKRNLF